MAMTGTIKHVRTIGVSDPEEEPEYREYTAFCSCQTVYESRLRSHSAAMAVMATHLDAVSSGEWDQEQADLITETLAGPPNELNEAKLNVLCAKSEAQSAWSEHDSLICRQQSEDLTLSAVGVASAEDALAAAIERLSAVSVRVTEASHEANVQSAQLALHYSKKGVLLARFDLAACRQQGNNITLSTEGLAVAERALTAAKDHLIALKAGAL